MKKVSLLVSMLLLSQAATNANFGESVGGSFLGSSLSNVMFSGNRGGDVDYVGREEARNMRAERQREERENREDRKRKREEERDLDKKRQKLEKEIKVLEKRMDNEDNDDKIEYYLKRLKKAQKQLDDLGEESYEG